MTAPPQAEELKEIFNKYYDDLKLSSTDYINEEIPSDRADIEIETAQEEAIEAILQWHRHAVDKKLEDLLYKLQRTYTPIRPPIKQSPMELTTEAKNYNRFVEDLWKFIDIELARLQGKKGE